jgi:bacillithiol biosynthesis cysteine-adding enzyme BshC
VRQAIDVSQFPWIRPLVSTYANNFASVASLFAGDPADETAWRSTIARVQHAPHDRARLAAILERQLAGRNAPPEARHAAARLRDPTSVAVVTGQQAGLFGGPLYTLLKAVSAVLVARRAQATYGTPTVAVFWVDAEDHDWDEVHAADVLDADFVPRRIALARVDGAGQRPVASLLLDDQVRQTCAELEAALTPTEFTAELLTSLRRHYRPGESVATAFAAWMDELVGRHGLVVFDGADAEAKPLVADLFARELERPGSTSRLAREAGDTLAHLGHEPQVEPADDTAALLYLGHASRQPIKWRDHDAVIGDTVRAASDVQAEAGAHPERFSPNVLLRPIVQDRLFPTIAYVAGPSELAYQAQLGGVYRSFGVEAPLLCPRASATLLDAAAARFLDRSHLPLQALHADDDAALNALLEGQLPPVVEQTLKDTERELVRRIGVIKGAVGTIDPTLEGAVETTVERMRDTLTDLHAKIIRAAKRKDDTLRRQFTRSRALAFPGGHPQERVLSVAFFVNRYGPAMVDRLIDVLPVEAGKHYILTL